MSFSMFGWIYKPQVLLTLVICFMSTVSAQPRVLTLTPHATELVYAAGAGDLIVATVNASNYPLAAQSIDRLGDGLNTSLEQVLKWKPDLVVGWPTTLMSRLKELGQATYVTSPESIEEIAVDVERLGELLGTQKAAAETVARLRQHTDRLQLLQHHDSRPTRVLVMASPDGEFVLGNDKLVNAAIQQCGGLNPFGHSRLLAPKVSLESIISSKPDLIVTGHRPSERLSTIAPVLVIDADLLYRPGPRFLVAADQICEAMKKNANVRRQQTESKARTESNE